MMVKCLCAKSKWMTLSSAAPTRNNSDEFGHMMQEQYQMSMMGELKFFLGLQIHQQHNDIFISQEEYLKDCLKKFRMQDCKGYTTPMPTKSHLDSDANGK